MVDDEALREKLAKVEALFRRAGSPGERTAAGAAMDRLHGRLGGSDRDREPEIEQQFSMPDAWSVRLFIAICRKHGVHPYRYGGEKADYRHGARPQTGLRPGGLVGVQPAAH